MNICIHIQPCWNPGIYRGPHPRSVVFSFLLQNSLFAAIYPAAVTNPYQRHQPCPNTTPHPARHAINPSATSPQPPVSPPAAGRSQHPHSSRSTPASLRLLPSWNLLFLTLSSRFALFRYPLFRFMPSHPHSFAPSSLFFQLLFRYLLIPALPRLASASHWLLASFSFLFLLRTSSQPSRSRPSFLDAALGPLTPNTTRRIKTARRRLRCPATKPAVAAITSRVAQLPSIVGRTKI